MTLGIRCVVESHTCATAHVSTLRFAAKEQALVEKALTYVPDRAMFTCILQGLAAILLRPFGRERTGIPEINKMWVGTNNAAIYNWERVCRMLWFSECGVAGPGVSA
jgi:hypothetical protein